MELRVFLPHWVYLSEQLKRHCFLEQLCSESVLSYLNGYTHCDRRWGQFKAAF